MWLISLSLIINSHDIISENKCPWSSARQDHSSWIPAFRCDIREIHFAARSQTFCQLCPEKQPLGPLRFPLQLGPLVMESRTSMQFVGLFIGSQIIKWCWGWLSFSLRYLIFCKTLVNNKHVKNIPKSGSLQHLLTVFLFVSGRCLLQFVIFSFMNLLYHSSSLKSCLMIKQSKVTFVQVDNKTMIWFKAIITKSSERSPKYNSTHEDGNRWLQNSTTLKKQNRSVFCWC